MTAAQLGSQSTEALVFFVLVQLVIIVCAARIAGEIAVRFAQSRAAGEIIAGILLGPSLLGVVFPGLFQYIFHSVPAQPMTVLSQIGLILLMFQIGLEFDFSHLSEPRHRGAVLSIALAGMLVPFALGFGFGWITAPTLSLGIAPLATALFTGTALSITALPILGRIMIEFKMTQTPLGVIAISAAAVNDVLGWLLLSVVTALAASNFAAVDLYRRLLFLLAFAVFSWWVLRPALRALLARARAAGSGLSSNVLGIVLACVFLSGIATYRIGIFTIFGGFMVGVLLHDQRDFVDRWRVGVGRFVEVFFLPIFFTYTGLRTNIGGLNSAALWVWCLLLIALATAGKWGACALAARWSGRSAAESRVIGVMMNTRALMELIVINVGLDLKVISPNVFTMLVLMAIFSTVITTPALRRWLPAAGIDVPADRGRDGSVAR